MEHRLSIRVPDTVSARPLVLLLVGALVATACSSARRNADRTLDLIDSERVGIGITASTVAGYRFALEVEPQVKELLRAGTAAAEAAQERLARGPDQISDQTAAVCAYVIEQLDYGPAVAALENYLEADPGNSGHFWGPVFAVRALLVLKGIPDPSGGLADYDDSTIQTAIWGP